MTFTPWNPATGAFYRMYIWSDDSKNTMLTTKSGIDSPITNILDLKRTQVLMQPDHVTVTFSLTDPLTGAFATDESGKFGKGNYYEIYIGKDQPTMDLATGGFPYHPSGPGQPGVAKNRLWASGYIQDIQKTGTKGAQFDIIGASALIWLSDFRTLNNLEMDFKTDVNSDSTNKASDFYFSYKNVMYALNGINPNTGLEGGPKVSQGPGQKGLLTGTGWFATYKHGSMTFEPITDSTHKPHPWQYMPGYGDSWYTAWEPVLMNLQTIASHYNCYFRESANSQPGNRQLEFGLLGDPSNVTVYGGRDLDLALNKNATHPANSFDAQITGLSMVQAIEYEDKMDNIVNLVWPLGSGSPTGSHGMTTIQSFFNPILNKDGKINCKSDVIELGNPNNSGGYNNQTLQTTSTDPSIKDYYIRWQPNKNGGREYYLMKTISIGVNTYYGLRPGWNTNPNDGPLIFYQLVAAQNQDGTWAYGVMEVNSAQKYGVHEYVLVEKKIQQDDLLLSSAIGAAEWNAEAVPTFTIPIKHPIDPQSGLPIPSTKKGVGTLNYIQIGQRLDVRFTGYVYSSITRSSDGQWYGTGEPYKYLHFPTDQPTEYNNFASKGDIGTVVNGISIDEHVFDKMSKIIQIDEEWKGHAYEVTYTLGKGKWKKKHWADQIAQRFIDQSTAPPIPYPNRHLKHTSLKGVNYILEYGANIDHVNGVIKLPSSGSMDGTDLTHPGGICVTDIEHDHFFDDSHQISFTMLAERPTTGGAQMPVLDFWFHKPLTSHLADINVDSNDHYGIVRFGFSEHNKNGNGINKSTSSGKKGGFYVQSGGMSTTPGQLNSTAPQIKQGFNFPKHDTNYSELFPYVEYNVTFKWHRGIYTVHIMDKSKQNPAHEFVARWDDMGAGNGKPILATWDETHTKYTVQYGAIGWRCFGGDGKAAIKIYNIDVHPLRNSKGITQVGEVDSNGLQHQVFIPTGTNSGTKVTSAPTDPTNSGNPPVPSKNLHVVNNTTNFSPEAIVAGAYPTHVNLGLSLIANTTGQVVDFNYQVKFKGGALSDKYNGLPIIAAPGSFSGIHTITIQGMDKNTGDMVSETIDIGGKSNVIEPNSGGQWITGINLFDYEPQHSYYGLNETSDKSKLAIVSWDHPLSGSTIKNVFIPKGDPRKFYNPSNPSKAIQEHGWAKLIQAPGSSNNTGFYIFNDGTIAWSGSKTVSNTGGLTAIATEAIDGSKFAAHLDKSGGMLFNADEFNSTTQRVFMYDSSGNSISGGYIDITSGNWPYYHYMVDGSGNRLGIPSGFAGANATEIANEMNASWVFQDENANISGDSDYIFQMSTGGTLGAQTVLWQDCQLTEDSINGQRKRRKYKVKTDRQMNFPVLIAPAYMNTSQTLGGVVDLAQPANPGDTKIIIKQSVNYVKYATTAPYDKWSLNPAVEVDQGSGSNQETIYITGTDVANNALIISTNPTSSVGLTYTHDAGEPMYQQTYQGAIVTSGGKLNGSQRMDEMLPVADAIAFGFLVEHNATISGPGGGSIGTGTPVTVSFQNGAKIIDKKINSTNTYLMIDYGNSTSQEVLTSWTPVTDSNGHITGFTATFANVHQTGATVTWARWYRGWYGNPTWKPPYATDTTANTGVPNYSVPLNSTKTLKYLGPLKGLSKNALIDDWFDMTCKTAQLGLWKQGQADLTIVGCEIAISSPYPFIVYFDAHTMGHPEKPPKSTSAPDIRKGAIDWYHKYPSGFEDANFKMDMYMWAQKDSDNVYRIHLEHDTDKGESQGTVTTLDNKHKFAIFSGPRQDGTGGGVSEDHPNYGIAAMPITDHSGTLAHMVANGNSNDPTDIKNMIGNYVFFNSNSSGFFVKDPGVQGNKVWVPGYNKCFSSVVSLATSNVVNISSADQQQWINYLYNGYVKVLVTQGTASNPQDPQVLTISSVTGNQITFSSTPNPPLISGNFIIGQTTGFAVVSSKFNWHERSSGNAILSGKSEDFYIVGQIGQKPDTYGEYQINSVGPHVKKTGSGTRNGTQPPSKSHQSNPAIHNHHNLIWFIDSTGKSPNSSSQCTFHAKKHNLNGVASQIETHAGKWLGALPYYNGTTINRGTNPGSGYTQQNVYINSVQPDDWIVYDTGSYSGYDPGFYAYADSGTYTHWYNSGNASTTWSGKRPRPAKFVAESWSSYTGPTSRLSQGRCYVNGKFSSHKIDSLGFILIGKVSTAKDVSSHQFYFQGTKPSSQVSTPKTSGKGTSNRKTAHPHTPGVKKRKKKSSTPNPRPKQKKSLGKGK